MRREEVFAYADVDAAIHWLLGHPAPVQGEMQFECQLVTYACTAARQAVIGIRAQRSYRPVLDQA
jgi:hypothetical protein